MTHFAERLKAPSNSLDADGTTCGQRCRFWVIRVDLAVGRLLPINPDEQTFAVSDGMSQMGHVQTHAAQQIASSHSTTLSARVNRASGTVTPIALAVLRLITSLNFVGCSMGRSAGILPRKRLATSRTARSAQ